MDFELSEMDEKKRFDVKLQISLYRTAEKVFREDKAQEFQDYMRERVEKIRKILEAEGPFRIFEDGNLIFEVRE